MDLKTLFLASSPPPFFPSSASLFPSFFLSPSSFLLTPSLPFLPIPPLQENPPVNSYHSLPKHMQSLRCYQRYYKFSTHAEGGRNSCGVSLSRNRKICVAMFPDLPNLYSAFTIISGYKQWRSQNRVVGRAQVGHIYGAVRMCGIKLACGKLNYKRMLEHKQKLLGHVPGCAGA